MSDTEKKLLPSLTEFVEKHSAVSEVYDTRRICAVTKYTMETYLSVYNNIIEHLRANPGDRAVHEKLFDTSDKIRQVSGEILSILKRGAEIDVMLSTKFDSLQVLALVQQLPTLLIDLITSTLNETIDRAESGEFKKSELAKQIEIQKIVDSFAERMREELEKVVVPLGTNEVDQSTADALAVQEDVIKMVQTVPIQESA